MIKANAIELVPIENIQANNANRNIHPPDQVERLKQIIKYQGFRSPLIISNRSQLLVAGHGRLLAARDLGFTHLPCIYQDFDDEDQEFAASVSDNAIASWADLDLAGINADLSSLGPFDIDLLGIRDFTVDVSENDKDPDETPAPPKVAKTKRGELWILGEHRLLCGDATSREDVERLMAGEKADMILTDPPYNVGFKYNEHDDTEINQDEWTKVCRGWYEQWKALAPRIVLTPGCYNLELWCRLGNPTHIAPWIKTNGQTTGRVTHFWQWEPIFFFGKFERKRANDIFEHYVNSGFLRGSGESPVREGGHPCPKPLTLWLDLVENFSDYGEIILEPFCGSGTTLIACEKTQRRCFGMEIDPTYCDVILDRWSKYSGKTAHREDGATWESIRDSVID